MQVRSWHLQSNGKHITEILTGIGYLALSALACGFALAIVWRRSGDDE